MPSKANKNRDQRNIKTNTKRYEKTGTDDQEKEGSSRTQCK